MQYEFVSPVKTNTTKRGKSIFLTVGIICFVIAFVAELSIGNMIAFVFVVPLLYLLRLRSQVGGRQRVKDTGIRLSIFDDKIELILFALETRRKGSFSKRYSIPKSDIQTCCADPESGKISIRFAGRMDWLDANEQEIGTGNTVSGQSLELMAPEDVCYALQQALKH